MIATWLQDAKVGDKVVRVSKSHSVSVPDLRIPATIERVSDTHVVANGTRYRKYDGKAFVWWGERLEQAEGE